MTIRFGFPRAPQRSQIVECFSDCRAQMTGNPEDCACGRRDDAAYEAECERRVDAWKDGDVE